MWKAPMQRAIDDDLSRVLYAQDPFGFLTHLFFAIAVSAVYFAFLGRPNVTAAWLGLYIFVIAGAVILWIANHARPRILNSRDWINLHALSNAFLYCAPGLSIWFAFQSADTDLATMHTLLIVLMAAGLFMSSGFDLFNFTGAIMALVMPAVVLHFAYPTREHAITGAILGLFLIAMNIHAARYRKLFRGVIEERMDEQLRAEAFAIEKRVTEEASLAKTRFFAAASHDLRQPLHAIGLLAESLKSASSAAQRGATVESIISNVEALNGLFNQVLDLARIESGVTQVIPLHFRLSELLARIDSQFRPTAAAKGLALRVAPTDFVAFTDPVLLERVLGNLVSNAVRYTEQGAIWVGLRRAGNAHGGYIEVRDSGIGIAPEEHRLVFEEFYQVLLPQRVARQGHGLGLSTVRRLVGLLGGELQMRSALGSGTTVRVPVREGDESLITARLSDPASVGASAAGRRILCIDDEPEILRALESLLERWGCIVRGVADECAAVQAIEDGFIPDALLCDFQLGARRTGAQAIDAVQQALARRGYRRAATMLITGDMASPELTALAALGYPVLHKPVTPTRLRRTLDTLWQHADRDSELERMPPAA